MSQPTKRVTGDDLTPAARTLLKALGGDLAARKKGQPHWAGAVVPARPWLGREPAARQRCRRALRELERLGLVERIQEAGRTRMLRLLAAGLQLLGAKPDRDWMTTATSFACPGCQSPLLVAAGPLPRRGHCLRCGAALEIKRADEGRLVLELVLEEQSESGLPPDGCCPDCGAPGRKVSTRYLPNGRHQDRLECWSCGRRFPGVPRQK